MPWCPVCRNEYKVGYNVCGDCGAPLVENLEDIDKIEVDTHNHDFIKNALEFAEDESLEDMEINNAYSDILEGKEDIFLDDKEYMDQVKEHHVKEPYQPFVKASDRADNYRSSAYALILVGVLGIVFLFLCLCNVIPVAISENIRVVGFVAMLVMFIAFIGIGVKSFAEAKTIDAFGKIEDELVNDINDFFAQNFDKNKIDEIALKDSIDEIGDEEMFFKRDAAIRVIIKEKFGEIDESLLDNQAENLYTKIYEND